MKLRHGTEVAKNKPTLTESKYVIFTYVTSYVLEKNSDISFYFRSQV